MIVQFKPSLLNLQNLINIIPIALNALRKFHRCTPLTLIIQNPHFLLIRT